MTACIVLACVYCLHILLKMHWITTGVIALYLLAVLPVHRRHYRKMKEERTRFDEAREYLDTLLYAFRKEEKVERALSDAETAMADGPMREVVRSAIDHMHMTFDNTDVMRESLAIIERAYPCERLRIAHTFLVHVEEYGGRIDRPVRLLISDKKRWESRTCQAMKERAKMFSDIVMSIAASLLICGMILYLPVRDIDISGSLICQILTAAVLVLDDWILLRAQRYMEADWLRMDLADDSEDAKRFSDYGNYRPRRAKRLSLLLSLPFLAGLLAAVCCRREVPAAVCLLLALLMLNQHRVGHSLARRSLIKRIKSAFPNWLLDIVLLLQSENVQVAIQKSQAHVPPVMEQEVARLVDRLMMKPEDAAPYHAFLQDFQIPEVHAAMSMLFSLSMGHSSQADQQLAELIDRNQEMLDIAERERMHDLGSGMYLLFLAPVLTASFKLVVDMAIFMLSFLAGAGVG